jgi:hypothetical protein
MKWRRRCARVQFMDQPLPRFWQIFAKTSAASGPKVCDPCFLLRTKTACHGIRTLDHRSFHLQAWTSRTPIFQHQMAHLSRRPFEQNQSLSEGHGMTVTPQRMVSRTKCQQLSCGMILIMSALQRRSAQSKPKMAATALGCALNSGLLWNSTDLC